MIKEISLQEAICIIVEEKPRGLYLTRDGKVWVAIDNHSGNVWTEEFLHKKDAKKWLLEGLY